MRDIFADSMPNMKPTKRSSLQSPNPVKHFAADIDGAAESESSSQVPFAMQDAATDLVGAIHTNDSNSVTPDGADAQHVDENGSASDIDIVHTSVAQSVRTTSTSPLSRVRPGAPVSPVSNRERFLAGFTPLRTCCNLDLCRAPAGNKFNLSAICIAVFPASLNPDRRYLQLADSTGVVGVTVWNENVHKFSNHSVGRLVVLQKAVISSHHGKKQLSLARDSVVKVGDDDQHEVCSWWSSLLRQVPKTCGAVHDMSDNSIISVAGVLGRISCETKIVNSAEKLLTCLHLVDASGKLDVRTWNHAPDTFTAFVDRPVLIQRVKVTSFASTKLCELFDSAGSIIVTEFPGKNELDRFWSE